MSELLARAATVCVAHDVDLDAFVRAAWSAYVQTRPGMREYLEEQQLREQLEALRSAGRLAEA